MNRFQLKDLEAREARRQQILQGYCAHCNGRVHPNDYMNNLPTGKGYNWFKCDSCGTTTGIAKIAA